MTDRPSRIDPESVQLGRADARMAESGVHVWAIIGAWRLAANNAQQVADDYGIPLADVAAALLYYCQHQAVIDARLTLHADAFN